jgi:hypothetical protein
MKAVLNMDRVNSVNTDAIGSAVFQMLDRLQHIPNEEQTVAAAVVVLLMCERYKANPEEIFRAARNLVAHAEGERDERLTAMRWFLKYEHKE